jgi:hypothetical protein
MVDLMVHNSRWHGFRERCRWWIVWVFVGCFGWLGGCPAPIQLLEVSCEGAGCTASDGGEQPELGRREGESMEKREVSLENLPEPVLMEPSMPEPSTSEPVIADASPQEP